ncbi:hypothetical protein HDU76_005790, partial [Blyttiomyces sp. JEL0837]
NFQEELGSHEMSTGGNKGAIPQRDLRTPSAEPSNTNRNAKSSNESPQTVSVQVLCFAPLYPELGLMAVPLWWFQFPVPHHN